MEDHIISGVAVDRLLYPGNEICLPYQSWKAERLTPVTKWGKM